MTTTLPSYWPGREIWTFNILEKSLVSLTGTSPNILPELNVVMQLLHNDLTSNKSLASKLWNIALQSLSNRECDALEASDTLFGILLYGTDPSTVFRWVDVGSCRVKENHNSETAW